LIRSQLKSSPVRLRRLTFGLPEQLDARVAFIEPLSRPSPFELECHRAAAIDGTGASREEHGQAAENNRRER
jgi:hypothetical protein